MNQYKIFNKYFTCYNSLTFRRQKLPVRYSLSIWHRYIFRKNIQFKNVQQKGGGSGFKLHSKSKVDIVLVNKGNNGRRDRTMKLIKQSVRKSF